MNWKIKASRKTKAAMALSLAALSFSVAHSLNAGRVPKRPHIWGISAVTILSTDIPATRDFYAKALGTATADAAEACNWCETLPHGPLFIMNSLQFVSFAITPSPPPSNLLGGVTLATDDLSELSRYLTAQKIKVAPTLTTFQRSQADYIHPAYAALSVTDLEGHRIDFVLRTKTSHSPDSLPSTVPSANLHIIHAGFIVHDRAATEHFYKDILGFRPYWHGGMKDDGKDDWVSLQVPDGTDWLEFMVNVSPDADQRVRGIMNHIAIGVTDIHETEKRLREAGAPVNEPPKIGRDGKWQLNLYDPDLTRIEFMEFTPVQKPCCSDFTGPHPKP